MATTDRTPPKPMQELTDFQRDLLFAIGSVGPASGLEVKAELEDYYGSEEHHGRLYPNLDTLVDSGLVNKAEADGRTNNYTLTDAGWQAIDARRAWEQQCVGRDESVGLTSDVHDRLLAYQRDGEDLSETLHRVFSLVPQPGRLPNSASADTIERDELVVVRARDEDNRLGTFTFPSAFDVHKDIERTMEVPADD